MTGQVLLQVIEGRKGGRAPNSGEAVTPGIGRGLTPRVPLIRVVDLTVRGGYAFPFDKFIDPEIAQAAKLNWPGESRVLLQHPLQPHVTAIGVPLANLRRGEENCSIRPRISGNLFRRHCPPLELLTGRAIQPHVQKSFADNFDPLFLTRHLGVSCSGFLILSDGQCDTDFASQHLDGRRELLPSDKACCASLPRFPY